MMSMLGDCYRLFARGFDSDYLKDLNIMAKTIALWQGYILRTIIATLLLLLCANIACASVITPKSEKILIISSYSPDSRRATEFLASINNAKIHKKLNCKFVIEGMSCGAYLDSYTWYDVMEKILAKHQDDNLKGVILLGQEAWATFISRKKKSNVPVFGCFVSRNGIMVPKDKEAIKNYNRKSVDMLNVADSLGAVGGVFNCYDVAENVTMIKTLYPNIDNIALLTDCTYGGMSMKALFEKEMKSKFPKMSYSLLDGSRYAVDSLKAAVNKMSRNTAALIGTWRVDNNGTFVMNESLEHIFAERKNMPIFSLSGVGVGTVAIGGFYPDYGHREDAILDNIYNHTAIKPLFNPNYYWYDAAKMVEYGIKDFQIPVGSRIIDDKDTKLKQYKYYIVVAVCVAIVLLLAVLLAVTMYVKKQKLNQTLIKQREALRKNQIELIRAKKEAEKSDKLKSAFLANMSHEIRTPLNAIVGFSELLKSTDDEDEREEYWSIISNNNDMLLRLIGDILDLSKIEAGMIDLKPVRFDMSDLVKSLYASMSQRCTNPDVELIRECAYKQCFLIADVNRVGQVLSNFLTNALKFTTKGYIRFGYECVDGGVRLFCEDTGTGIEPEKLSKVFTRFYKLNDFTQGTGLGMAICKAIMDEMHGKINVKSEVGKGSMFWAWFPVDIEIPEEEVETK